MALLEEEEDAAAALHQLFSLTLVELRLHRWQIAHRQIILPLFSRKRASSVPRRTGHGEVALAERLRGGALRAK